MKKSTLLKIVSEEVQRAIQEYGMESIYFSPAGFEQIGTAKEKRLQRYSDPEKWRVVAMQMGAIVRDRGDDWIAELPNGKILGTFGKMTQYGTLTFFN